jgi:peptidoglycan/xylan/chitin deacetylase (PgdA/CDA1 family)
VSGADQWAPGRWAWSVGRSALHRSDQLVAWVAPKDRQGLVVFMFHMVFADQAEAEGGLVHPHERATCEGLSRLFAHFRDHGYRFVSANEIDRGLPVGGLYAHVTFDDGLANNLRLLDLLPREEVPVTIFPSVSHVRDGKAFWWNVVYREWRAHNRLAEIEIELARLRELTIPLIERYLLAEFGSRALEPRGDVDRPLTKEELGELAGCPWVEVGNHGLDHVPLTQCTDVEAGRQIGGAQRWLTGLLGHEPYFIAYPNGDVDAPVVDLSRRQGLRLGVTVVPVRNRLPTPGTARMELGRFEVVFDRRERSRMRAVRSSVQLTAAARTAARSFGLRAG